MKGDIVLVNFPCIIVHLDFSDYSPMFASEKCLSKDWLLPEEDEAWKDL